MARWLETLNTYNFEIRHRPGRQHGNADGLSRRQCFPCSYCSKQDQKEIDNSDETSVDLLRMAKMQDSQETSCSNKTDSTMWYEHKTNQEMFEAQKSDNVLFNLYRLKSDNNNRPDWADVALQDVKLKKYWSQWDRIVLINNVLYRKWINATTEESDLQFIVPEIWKENIMKMLHDDIQVGHFGIHKTVARAQNRFYWVGQEDAITKWVQNCIVCNSRKQPPRKAKSKMKQYNVGAPMERVALDMTFFCFQCGAEYNLRRQLTRHVRDKHPKKMLQCRFCSYLVPTSKKFRLVEHEKHVHRHIMNPRNKDRELIIQETPPRSTVPTNFIRRHNKENCTNTRPRTPPLTPNLDSRHLELPAIGDEICPEDRFQFPPSRFQCSYEASKFMIVAEKARKTGKYSGSVPPSGYGAVRKDETCILPDGTVYKLTATWIQDPSFCILKEKETQTEMLRQQMATQTEEDRRVVQVTSATQTRRIIVIEKKVQTVEDNRIVVDKETEEELNFRH
ncbi:unnamed protein product [Mytilus coruscus]|uniref:C2H2-type domain-containing protein n=1 Tax=Mytilus coruscus TaxID=42192 RepID=A0A6J8EBS5_MYTCO|nr:unnamed protein product [Mytilus coruscus]